ncbi:hypothetical protein F2Q69_00049896 [Brassica cretica]|uniref:Cation-transporting P-type ATPase N-terminal domain-containing protein n=1 Tax=Brassica cretica TaxID=69181 RepID=A0A8S9PKT3_BRACR|nr:hypothetical protein F2Q69_00049896 [Brassica cretica]
MAAGKDSSWDDIKNEGIDLEKIPIEEVFTQLRCTREGLTSDEGHTRLEIFGKQDFEVLRVYVEPSFMGHGVGCYHGYRLGQRRRKATGLARFRGSLSYVTFERMQRRELMTSLTSLLTEDFVLLLLADRQEQSWRAMAVSWSVTSLCPGEPWQFLGLLPLFDPPRHDSAETIRRALDLGVNVKMITGDQLAIGKETGRRLGMGTNMYPSSALLGQDKDEAISSLPVDELIEMADGFAGVFPEHKYEIVKRLQEMKHICGMTGDGVNDAPALKRADIGIAVADATDAARSASDIVLTEPGLSVIVSAVLTSRAIFQRMKNYTIYAVSITIRVVLGFMLLALIWKYDFSPFMVLVIAILNDGTIMTISKDRVKPSPLPDSWKLKEIFATGVVLGTYLAVMTVVFFWAVESTDFFSAKFGVRSISGNPHELTSAIYLQVSIISQALIFVTRSRSWSYAERPGFWLIAAFFIAQLIATIIAVYANWDFARIRGTGWGWAGVIWLYSIVTYIPLDILKFIIRYALSGRAWDTFIENKTAFTSKKDYGKGEREAQWAQAQRTLHGLQPAQPSEMFNDKSTYRELSEIADQAKRRAEVARQGSSNGLVHNILFLRIWP